MASMGPALWITALNVKYRDFRYVIPFITQFGLYVSPVGFSSSVVPEEWRLLYSLNPDGRRHRRFPLVHSEWPEPALSAWLGGRLLRSGSFSLVRLSPISENGKGFCRSDLNTGH
jgi:ABC-type polysaccharide/polyol phosphate export permease